MLTKSLGSSSFSANVYNKVAKPALYRQNKLVQKIYKSFMFIHNLSIQSLMFLQNDFTICKYSFFLRIYKCLNTKQW